MNNREIKFRAWGGKGMIQNETDFKVYLDIRYGRPVTLEQEGFKYLDTSFWKLMQYTGLKDKNGKEIYEGDILKLPDNDGVDTVVWRNFGFWLDDFHDSELYGDAFTNSEVIGNIYENLELVPQSEEQQTNE